MRPLLVRGARRPSQPGTWEFDVWVRDADGNDANELTGTFEVAEGG